MWADGASNGGQSIDYYRVSHDQSTGTYIVAMANVVTKSYTIVGLTPGNTYNIKVEAHNAIGFSVASQPFAIIAATNPSTPNAPTTTVSNKNVLITWVSPATGGSAITGYLVKIRESDGVTYSANTLYCDGLTTLTVINT